MEFFALPDEFVKKIAFIGDVIERDQGHRPSDILLICAAIDLAFDGFATSIGHGVCDDP